MLCPYLYYICNEVKFAVNVSDDYHVEMALHNLLNNIHSQQKDLTLSDINEKINSMIEKHNLSCHEKDEKIISNVSKYWEQYGSKYDIFKSNYLVFMPLDDCNLYGTIDLIINDQDGYSIIQFIFCFVETAFKEYPEIIIYPQTNI